MNIEKLLKDYHIPYATEHKNIRDGWIGVHCPFCKGTKNYHLGYNLDENYWSCWRCGGHSSKQVIANLLSVSHDNAEQIIERYKGTNKPKVHVKVKSGHLPFRFPNGELKLTKVHKKYLTNRGFDWEKIQKEWGITGTGPVAKLDKIDYSRRIVAPIRWDGKIVSFQTRDITGKHPAKYMACPPEREKISHKQILYGNPEKWGRRGICVEGITDVWRLGPSACATFGIKFTYRQMKLIHELFDEMIILFDPEPIAQAQAKKLAGALNIRSDFNAIIEKLDCDPGDLSQGDADHLVKNILK